MGDWDEYSLISGWMNGLMEGLDEEWDNGGMDEEWDNGLMEVWMKNGIMG
jgi:hypothetical protein